MIKLAYLAVLGAVVGTLLLGLLPAGASLLPSLLFWVALVQGAVALAAAGELTRARWILPLRPVLLGLHPLLLIFPFAFLVFSMRISVYPWTEHPNAWLSPGFFITRNVLLLLLTWALGTLYARADGSARSGKLAVLYVLAFVVTQSIIAFDWVMSFEYPWISTLLGGYFFVESLYVGIALAGLLAAWRVRRRGDGSRVTLRDAATLLFGFSLLWAGQFFAQYLVIWYGNIPEEAAFLVRRLSASPLRQMSSMVLGCLFFVPFLVLLSRRTKSSPGAVTVAAVVVGAGVLVERLVLLWPVMPLNFLVVAGEFVLLAAACAVPLRRQALV